MDLTWYWRGYGYTALEDMDFSLKVEQKKVLKSFASKKESIRRFADTALISQGTIQSERQPPIQPLRLSLVYRSHGSSS